MSDSDQIFNQAGADIFARLGTDATYNGAISCKVHVTPEVTLQPGGFVTGSFESVTTLEARLEEIGQEPNTGDTFEVGATTYTVDAVAENDGFFVTVIVK